ncbi:P-loop containing nucleoside triphosphate hydrolase protein [Xylariaceae sp. FL1651]|nr:P-loop containing nucleoside triphosphate hydrolase protein [Xylariaceae sp. FL1651]
MDKYEAVHGRDVSSFDLTSTHRLPTVSAAQALDDLRTDPGQFIPTGIEDLDRSLANKSLDVANEPQHCGGLQKGQTVEIWGPPGSGKTTFAMQLAANTLRDGGRVVWLLSADRITSSRATSPIHEPAITNLTHYFTSTLAHLIGLLCKPAASSVPSGTSLIVIDGLSGLINHAFPRNHEPRQAVKKSGPTAKRLQVLQFLIASLQKLAATRDLVMLVLTQCATKMQVERGATIIPAINASTWERGIATRLVLFRDWATIDAKMRDLRLVGVQKNNGQVSPDGFRPMLAFEIRKEGLVGLELSADQPPLALTTDPHRQKRKIYETDFEIADSEGEDYGWEDDDEAEMPSMPPQWQGSEDLLLGRVEEDENQADEVPEVENIKS